MTELKAELALIQISTRRWVLAKRDGRTEGIATFHRLGKPDTYVNIIDQARKATGGVTLLKLDGSEEKIA